eukprot:TRINITY_DN24473_c0_g1_i2.p1 TRINITY_DN24473_c0_g1~~TRINITY_DN24473_c0_g1_i2.p1  ORF type:complete len:430 (-),score=81.27 TRINITY_DN24473_c0_g1_i2:227-1474(-)
MSADVRCPLLLVSAAFYGLSMLLAPPQSAAIMKRPPAAYDLAGRRSLRRTKRRCSTSEVPEIPAAMRRGKLHIAPMMGYTDRHFRYLMRLMSDELVLWTEMMKDTTLIHYQKRDDDQHLQLLLDPEAEGPVVLQLGGCDPKALRDAAQIAAPFGYEEVNLNCGCPSPKAAKVEDVSGFGAFLMKEPERVAECVAAIADGSSRGTSVSVKCRIGTHETVADQERDGDEYETLLKFVDTVAATGHVQHFVVHARSAILSGLSPLKNRRIPPLHYDFVHRLSRDRPDLRITINGGIVDCTQVADHMQRGLDVMVGRWAIKSPWALAHPAVRRAGRGAVLDAYAKHCKTEIQTGRQDHWLWLAQPLTGLFAGVRGSSAYKAVLREEVAQQPFSGGWPRFSSLLKKATDCLPPEALAPPG